MNLLQNLNEQQLAAVTLPNQSALILAGAGSGKTRVLTTRIAWLIQTGQMSPQGVLAVTFTNKAAKEMLTRLSAMLPINTRGMWIGTFHGLCNRMLRAHHRDAGLPSTFQILDSADQLGAIKRLLKANNVDDERYPPRNLQQFINSSKEAGLRARDVEVNDDYNRKFVELYAIYDAQCNREGVCDFAELLLRCYELLDRNEILRQHYQDRFRHILVDEFQDTNKLQYAWLKMLAGAGRNAIFAVGDDDQSIYAFRGANVGNMSDFEREFRVQQPDQARAELPLGRPHPERRQRADREQRAPPRQGTLDRRGRGRAGPDLRGADRRLRGRVAGRGGQGPDRRGPRARRDRGAVPLQRAVARDRARALQRRHSVPRVRRAALLRARGDQARARLPAPDREPVRRHGVPARRELPAARHRRAHARAAGGRRARRQREPVRGGRRHDRHAGRQARRVREADREPALRDGRTCRCRRSSTP